MSLCHDPETGDRGEPEPVVVTARVLGERTLGLSGPSPEHLLRRLREALGPGVVIAIARGDLDGHGTPGAAADLLSERELAVVRLITRGHSNEEVADRLYISYNTVKSYIRTAYRKMNVRTRSEAVLWGVRHGLDTR